MSGNVVHFEIPSDDIDRARQFYHRTFGWKMDPMPSVDYTIVTTTETTKEGRPKYPGAINGGLLRRQEPVRTPTVTIHVDDIDRAAQRIQKNGGTMVEPKAPIGDGSMGFQAYFRDSEGNVIGLYQRPTK